MSDLALPGPICDNKCREPQHIWGKWGTAKPVKISLSLNHSSFLNKSIIVDRATEVAIKLYLKVQFRFAVWLSVLL